jgi:predicted nuclease of restriction endonuclease-like (RecB) superfamily
MKFDLLVNSIEQTHRHFQQQASKAVNVSLTLRNWLIGFYMVEYELHGEDRASYGHKLIDELAIRLKSIKGIDRRALYRFKDFYTLYPQIAQYISSDKASLFLPGSLPVPIVGSATPQSQSLQKVGTLNPQSQMTRQVPAEKILSCLSYSHIEQIMQVGDSLKRTFYEIACINGTWSVKELKRQINSLYFERSGMSAKPELLSEITNQKAEVATHSEIFKSVYVFEFLGLKVKDAVEESDLETALLNHLQDFLIELGHGFCFEARQKRLLIDDEYYFVDLVFYHRILKCHVLVELKIDEFKHDHLSQLNTYVSYYREEVKCPDDNHPIGILLCTKKGKKLVEYALSGMDNQLFVSKYLLELPKKEQLEAFITNELLKWNR